MRRIAGIAVLAASLAAGTAQAQAPVTGGVSFGARIGYGVPMGDADGGNAALLISSIKMGDIMSSQVPIQLEAMFRIERSWSLGLYLQYGFASVNGSFCGAGCSGTDVRFGAQAQYRFEGHGFYPWVGFGFGGEWASVSASGYSGNIYEASGFEFLNLQLGGDWLVSPNFRFGPFVQLSLSQFDTVKEYNPASGALETLPVDKTVHEWLQFGLRGTFDF